MTIGQFARKDVVTATLDTSVVALAHLMKDHDVGSVVIASDGRPVGIVTDRDLVVYGLAGETASETLTSRDVMSTDLFSVDAETPVFAAISRLSAAGVRRVPVTDDGDLVGIVTLDDLLVVLANELTNLAGVIEQEMPPVVKHRS